MLEAHLSSRCCCCWRQRLSLSFSQFLRQSRQEFCSRTSLSSLFARETASEGGREEEGRRAKLRGSDQTPLLPAPSLSVLPQSDREDLSRWQWMSCVEGIGK